MNVQLVLLEKHKQKGRTRTSKMRLSQKNKQCQKRSDQEEIENGKSQKQVPGEGLSGQKQNFSWAVHKAFFSSAHRSLSETHIGNNALENTIEIQNPMAKSLSEYRDN